MDKIRLRIYEDTNSKEEYCALGISFNNLTHTATGIENYPDKVAWSIIRYYKLFFEDSVTVSANGTRVYFRFNSLGELIGALKLIFKPDATLWEMNMKTFTEKDNPRYARLCKAYKDRKILLEIFSESPYTDEEINEDMIKRTFEELVLDEDGIIISLFNNQTKIPESDIIEVLEKYFKDLLDTELIPELFNEVHPSLIPERLYTSYTPDIYKCRKVNTGMNLITLNYRSNEIPSHSLAGEFVTHFLFRALMDLYPDNIIDAYYTNISRLVCRLCEFLKLSLRSPYIISLIFCFNKNVTDDIADYHYNKRKRYMKELRKYISKKRFNRYKKELLEVLNSEAFDFDMVQMDSPSLEYFGTDKKTYVEFAENLDYGNFKKVINSLEFVEMIVEGDGKDAIVEYVRR